MVVVLKEEDDADHVNRQFSSCFTTKTD